MANKDTVNLYQAAQAAVERVLQEDTRTEAKNQRAQLYAHNPEKTKALIKLLYMEAGFPEDYSNTKASEINKYMETELATADSKALRGLSKVVVNKRQKDKAYFLNGEGGGRSAQLKEGGDFKLYFVFNYNTVETIKRKVGKLIEKDSKSVINSSKFTGSQQKGQSDETLTGQHIGHGEFGAPIIGYKIAKIKQVLEKFGGFSPLIKKIEDVATQHDVTTRLTAKQTLTATGSFRKSYTLLISGQDAGDNKQDARKKEKPLSDAVNNVLSQEFDIANLKGSPSLLDATGSVLAYPFTTKGKRIKVTSKKGTKPSKSVKNKSSAKGKSTIRKKSRVNLITGSLTPEPGSLGTSNNKHKSSATNTLAIIQEFNRRLPEQLQKNMQTPALNYRTGRFAESVRVVDSVTTPRGFQSFGYTYQKYPYQTFEPGYAMGSVERDPRKLIDRSMREIAVELALTRFYTRRV